MLSLFLITAGAIAATLVPAAPSQVTTEQRQPLWWQGNDFRWVCGGVIGPVSSLDSAQAAHLSSHSEGELMNTRTVSIDRIRGRHLASLGPVFKLSLRAGSIGAYLVRFGLKRFPTHRSRSHFGSRNCRDHGRIR